MRLHDTDVPATAQPAGAYPLGYCSLDARSPGILSCKLLGRSPLSRSSEGLMLLLQTHGHRLGKRLGRRAAFLRGWDRWVRDARTSPDCSNREGKCHKWFPILQQMIDEISKRTPLQPVRGHRQFAGRIKVRENRKLVEVHSRRRRAKSHSTRSTGMSVSRFATVVR